MGINSKHSWIPVRISAPDPHVRRQNIPLSRPQPLQAVPGKSFCRNSVTAQVVSTDAPLEVDEICPRGDRWKIHKFGGTCMGAADLIKDVCDVVINDPAEKKVAVVSAMGSHPTSPVKVTDLILKMIDKASRQDVGFMLDLTSLQESHVDTAKKLLGDGMELNQFLARLMDDMANLKAMLHAISIGKAEYAAKKWTNTSNLWHF